MFGLTKALVPYSSRCAMPSIMMLLLVTGAPLIVMLFADVQLVKSRLRFESCTPGITASRP